MTSRVVCFDTSVLFSFKEEEFLRLCLLFILFFSNLVYVLCYVVNIFQLA